MLSGLLHFALLLARSGYVGAMGIGIVGYGWIDMLDVFMI